MRRWLLALAFVLGLLTATTLSAMGGQPFNAQIQQALRWLLSNPQTVSAVWTFTVPPVGAGVPGGADTQVQFNDAGAFGGDAGLTYNKTTDALTLAGTGASSGLRFTATEYIWNDGFATISTSIGDAAVLRVHGSGVDVTGGALNIGTFAAGVALSASDGVLTVLGLGNGADESLAFDFDNAGANTVGVSSSTGVTLLNFGSIGLTSGALTAPSLASTANADGCFGWFCRKTVTLTNAQILALPGGPSVEVLPAPGANKVYNLHQARCFVDARAGAYANFDANGLMGFGAGNNEISSMYNENADGAFQDNSAIHVLEFGTEMRASTSLTRTFWQYDLSALVNTAMVFFATNGAAGDFTGGNAANTMQCVVFYSMTDTP